VNTQPNHVLPLAHFGAIPGVHDGGVVRGPIAMMLVREAGAPNNTTWRFAMRRICWWLVKPITGQTPSTAASLE
jgi:hypothetical protein